MSPFNKTVIPGELNPVSSRWVERDPWFDTLTTLSEVDPSTELRVDPEQGRSIEGESRIVSQNQIILDPGSHPAPRDLAGMTNCDIALWLG